MKTWGLALVLSAVLWSGGLATARAADAMSENEIYTALAQRTGLKKDQVKAVLAELSTLACEEAKRGFTVPGLGKLTVTEKAAHKGRNPRTGEEIDIPAKKTLKFTVSKTCADATGGDE